MSATDAGVDVVSSDEAAIVKDDASVEAPTADLHADMTVERETVEGARLGTWWLCAAVFVVAGAIAVATIAIVQVQENPRRALFLIVPFAAVISWLLTRVVARRTVVRAIATGLGVAVLGFLADWITGLWYLRAFYQYFGVDKRITDVAGKPVGEWHFMVDRIWSYKDYLLWGAAALVAIIIMWPSSSPVTTATIDAPGTQPDVDDYDDNDNTFPEDDLDVSEPGELDDTAAR